MPRTRGCYDSDPADWSPQMVEEFRRKQRPICFEPQEDDAPGWLPRDNPAHRERFGLEGAYDTDCREECCRWVRWDHAEEVRKRMFTCAPEEDTGARTLVACGKGPAKPAVKA